MTQNSSANQALEFIVLQTEKRPNKRALLLRGSKNVAVLAFAAALAASGCGEAFAQHFGDLLRPQDRLPKMPADIPSAIIGSITSAGPNFELQSDGSLKLSYQGSPLDDPQTVQDHLVEYVLEMKRRCVANGSSFSQLSDIAVVIGEGGRPLARTTATCMNAPR